LIISFLVSYNPYASEGASANRWRSIIDGLKDNNANVKLLILGGWLSKQEYETYGKNGYIDSQKNIEYVYVNNQKNFNIWSSRLNTYFLDILASKWYSKKLLKILSRQKCNVLFLQPHLNVFRIFHRLPDRYLDNVKVVMEMNEFNDVAIEHATNFIHRKNIVTFNSLLLNTILLKLDTIFVMTETLKFHFSTLNIKGLSIQHLPMTVDLNRFSDNYKEVTYQKPYIAYCGSSSFKKDGIDILIKSFEKIADNYPSVTLYLAAYFENDGSKMLDLIKISKYSQRIIYLGTLHRDQIPAFISNTELCVLPRPASKQAQGGFPTKLGEYLASGRPVCVTSVGEIPSYLEDKKSAFLAEPDSIDSFAEAMENVLSNPIFANTVGENGKMVAQQSFNKDIQGKQLYDYLSKLINTNAK
jgi:glycosyltransferase involved in cell wall biosynthesis